MFQLLDDRNKVDLSKIKKTHIFENKYKLYELEKETTLRHDIMSYGEKKGKFITDTESLIYLATTSEYMNGMYCFVENKTPFYRLAFDFDYKIQKYPEMYKGFENMDEIITMYIVNFIITSLKEIFNKPDVHYIYSEKKNSKGQHINFPNIIVNKEIHNYIFEQTLKKIYIEKKYPNDLINKIFDNSVANANGIRLWYNMNNNDYYYPVLHKSTFVFDKEPRKHFYLCLLNTNYITYNFNLLISEDLINNNNKVINIKQKDKDIKKGIIKTDDEYIEDFKTLNLEDKKYLFLELIEIISIERINNRNDWIRLIYMFKNYGLNRNLIINLSKKSTKFNNEALKTINDIYDGKRIKSNTKIISLGTLIKWAKEDNPTKTNILFNKYHLTEKLDIKKIDEILLSRTNIKTNFEESAEHISDIAVKKFKDEIDNEMECLIIKSPTGTGKTTCITKLLNYYLEKNPKASIISVVTRRSMACCHITAFNKENKLVFCSYLDKKYDQIDYFISSLENLIRVIQSYDIVILDEVNSLINYFYSTTLEGKRIFCILQLIELLDKCKLVIGVDANITDMVMQLFTQMEKKIYFYVNTYANKKDVKLNIHYSTNYNEESNIISFCEKYINEQYVKKGKTCLIMTDSKRITEFLKTYFYKFNSNCDYYRVFNKDEGTLEDIIVINKIGEGRLIIFNSKICYGVDITIKYDEIFVIYKRTSGLKSMNALEMIQQISRARYTKAVNLLVLDPKSKNSVNYFISYENNKKIQEFLINRYVKHHEEICKKLNIVNEFGCVTIDIKGKCKFNDQNFLTEIHYLKTWYDQLFHRNKIDIIKLVAKEYGYIIKEEDWTQSDMKLTNSFKKELKLNKEELVEVSKKIYKNEIIDNKYKFYIENIKETNKMREKYLKLNNEKLDIDLICDQDKFTNHIYKKYLDLDKEEFLKAKINFNNLDLIQIIKDNDLLNKIDTCFWFEEKLDFIRYEVNNIKCDDLNKIKKLINDNIWKFYYIYMGNESKGRVIVMIKNKIEKINSLNRLQKFIADCYNNIADGAIKIKCKKQYVKKGEQLITYIFD